MGYGNYRVRFIVALFAPALAVSATIKLRETLSGATVVSQFAAPITSAGASRLWGLGVSNRQTSAWETD